ncbi:MAG: hypothetical protein HRU19_05230 [Pseudobacteriovorax sp.]|nr:hypothetical protein [Pseudobacteriovorax sp.]
MTLFSRTKCVVFIGIGFGFFQACKNPDGDSPQTDVPQDAATDFYTDGAELPASLCRATARENVTLKEFESPKYQLKQNAIAFVTRLGANAEDIEDLGLFVKGKGFVEVGADGQAGSFELSCDVSKAKGRKIALADVDLFSDLSLTQKLCTVAEGTLFLPNGGWQAETGDGEYFLYQGNFHLDANCQASESFNDRPVYFRAHAATIKTIDGTIVAESIIPFANVYIAEQALP